MQWLDLQFQPFAREQVHSKTEVSFYIQVPGEARREEVRTAGADKALMARMYDKKPARMDRTRPVKTEKV